MGKKNKKYKKELEQYKLQIYAYRTLNENLMYQASQNFDKYLISLSAGALALSLTFISTLFKNNILHYSGFLYISWICWGITIVSILYSFMTSYRSHSIAIEQIDNESIYNEKPGKHYTIITTLLSWIAGISFLIAIISICFFVGLNMKGEKTMATKKPLHEGTIPKAPPPNTAKRGTVPKTPPPPPPKKK